MCGACNKLTGPDHKHDSSDCNWDSSLTFHSGPDSQHRDDDTYPPSRASMPRTVPIPAQNFLSSVILPLSSLLLLPVSAVAVVLCVLHDRFVRLRTASEELESTRQNAQPGCVIISGGRMTKGLT